MQYLPPRWFNAQFNVQDYDYQDQNITYADADAIYLRPLRALKTALASIYTSVNTWVSIQYFTSKLYLQSGSGIHIVDSNLDISPTEIGYLDNISTNIQTQLTTNTYVPTTSTGTITTRTLLGQYSDTYFTPTNFNSRPGDIITSSYDGKYLSFVGKNSIYVSSTYGATFTQQTNATAGIIYHSIQMNSTGQYQVAVSQGVSASNIYVSNNYGVSFVSIQNISVSNEGRWAMSITLSSDGRFINVAGGGGAGIQSYYSNNYGSTFVQYGNIYNRFSSVMLNSTKIIALSTFNNNIITVSPLSSSTSEIETSFNTFLDAIRICANASGNIVIIISNSGTKYWISIDSGANFTEKSGFPVSLIYAKFIDNVLYLASSTGYVYKSSDYGVSFTASNTGLNIQCFSVNSYGFMMLTTDGKIYKGYEPPGIAPTYIYPSLKLTTGVNTEYVSDKFKFDINNNLLYINSNSVSTASASPGAYFMIPGVSSFPVFARINDLSALEMYPYIQSDHDSIALLPSYSIFIFSEINQTGRYLSMGNLTANVKYYPISNAYRIKSCVLYRYDSVNQAYAEVLSVSNVQKTTQAWN